MQFYHFHRFHDVAFTLTHLLALSIEDKLQANAIFVARPVE